MNKLEVPDIQAGNILTENNEVKEKEAKQGTFQIFNNYRTAIILLQMRISVFYADLLRNVLYCIKLSVDFLLSLNAIKYHILAYFSWINFTIIILIAARSFCYYKIIKNKYLVYLYC